VDPILVQLDPDQTRLIVAGPGLPMTASEMSRSGGIDPNRIAATGTRLRHCRRRDSVGQTRHHAQVVTDHQQRRPAPGAADGGRRS
jgi:hypothetical protein